ncbi:hypothetical protein C1I97_27085, partial [Streptomyces sp. NTH33]
MVARNQFPGISDVQVRASLGFPPYLQIRGDGVSEPQHTGRATVVDGRDRLGKPLYERESEVTAAQGAVEAICAGGQHGAA